MTVPPASRAEQLEQQFRAFDKANPIVGELFERFTLEVIGAGHKHYSADAIIHRVRWETSVVVQTDDDFKINNNHVAFYARRFMEQHPAHKGFFRTREQRSAADPPRM
jgi:hypothetical protein